MTFWLVLRRVGGRARRLIFGDYVFVKRSVTQPWHHLQAMRQRIVGGQIAVRFCNIPADFFVDARSDLAARALADGSYEPEVVSLLPHLPDEGDYINVGANVGIIAIATLLAGPTRRVVCIEPLPECVTLLEQNLTHAGVRSRAAVISGAAGATTDGTLTLHTVPGRPEYTSGGPLVHAAVDGAQSHIVEAPKVTIDSVAAEHLLQVAAIIIDCEGGELHVLKGAKDVLHRHRPVVVLEVDDRMLRSNGASSHELLRLLAQWGYECRNVATQLPVQDEAFVGTVIAVHRSAGSDLFTRLETRENRVALVKPVTTGSAR